MKEPDERSFERIVHVAEVHRFALVCHSGLPNPRWLRLSDDNLDVLSVRVDMFLDDPESAGAVPAQAPGSAQDSFDIVYDAELPTAS